jgi:hypothetical protein
MKEKKINGGKFLIEGVLSYLPPKYQLFPLSTERRGPSLELNMNSVPETMYPKECIDGDCAGVFEVENEVDEEGWQFLTLTAIPRVTK